MVKEITGQNGVRSTPFEPPKGDAPVKVSPPNKDFNSRSSISSSGCPAPFCCFTWICDLVRTLWDSLCCCFSSKGRYEIPNLPISAAAQAAQPVGISRGWTNNCCFIALLQGFAHIPSWRAIAKRIPTLNATLIAYDQAQNSKRPLSQNYPAALRDLCHALEPKHGWARGGQEDLSEILTLLLQSAVRSEEAPPPYYLINEIRSSTGSPRANLFQMLPYGTVRPTWNFAELAQASFQEKASINRFLNTPEELLFYNPPFVQDPSGHTYKDTKPLEGEIANFHLPRFFIQEGEEGNYSCDYFVIHIGSISSGHYCCARKVEGQWFICDDNKTYPITEEKAIQLMRKSSLLHYTQIQKMEILQWPM